MIKPFNIKGAAFVVFLTLTASVNVNAQVDNCQPITSNITQSESCNTGIALTGNNNLTIGTPTSGMVTVTNPGGNVVSVFGTGSTINNTVNGAISAGDKIGINNFGTIATLTNSNTISAGNDGIGISNAVRAEITTLANSGTISVGNYGAGISIYDYGKIENLTNSGTIRAEVEAYGIYNIGTINALTNTNSGTISVGDNYGSGIINGQRAEIPALTNSGTIRAGVDGFGIRNQGTIATLTNTISGTIEAGDRGRGIYNEDGLITALTNSGMIKAGDNGVGIFNYGRVTPSIIISLTNSGTIRAGDAGVGLYNLNVIETLTNTITGTISAGINNPGIINGGTIGILNNSGMIRAGVGGYGIDNSGTIRELTNTSSGTIEAGTPDPVTEGGFGITNSGTINTITNLGTIRAGVDGFGIRNQGTIVTLNNAQGAGNAAGALTYVGNLPQNYGIILGSNASTYGKLSVSDASAWDSASGPGTGTTTFGINSGTVKSTKYTAVISGVTASLLTSSSLTGTYSSGGKSYTYSLALESGSSTIWDLLFPTYVAGPSVANTNQSLVNTASALQGTYTLQNSVLANSFSYDCNVFGANNVCVSAGGRNTQVQAANGLNNTSALLIAAYRPHPNYRIGAYADQNLSVSNPGGTVNLGNNTPLIGLFGAWSQRLDGTGAEVKVSAAYGQKNTTITRSVVGSGDGASEAGSGSSKLNSQGAQVTAKYGFAVMDKAIVSPYVGVRYTQNNMGGYTEATSSSVTAPLTYSALNTNATTALAGVGASYKAIPTVTTFASAGVETDTNTANGTYLATNSSIGTLTPVNFNANPVRTRPTATLGAYYDIAKNQRFGVTGIYRQEAYQAVSTTTVMATYTIGL